MRETRKKRLEAAGWRIGDTKDFLGLSDEEAAFVELKLALADFLRRLRIERGWTQARLAREIGSSQSRVARMEAADPSVTMDLQVKSLLALGATRRELAEVVGRP